jgi:hypothetical protein
MKDESDKENPSDKPAWELMTASVRGQRELPDDLAATSINLGIPASRIGVAGLLEFRPDGERLH